jgi:DNA-binding NtrC family response regulator
MNMPALLVLNADLDEKQRIEALLGPRSARFVNASSLNALIGVLNGTEPELFIVCSYSLNPSDQMEMVRKIRSRFKQRPIIVMARHKSEKKVLGAMRAGATDYYSLGCDDAELLRAIHKHNNTPLQAPLHNLETDKGSHTNKSTDGLIGESRSIQNIKAFLKKLTLFDCTVLVTGETGTGKNLIAKIIHNQSFRRKNPFVQVNCAALPETLVESELFGYEKGAFTGANFRRAGKFEAARNGTILLDEISEMTHHMQAKLLTALESKQIYQLGSDRTRHMHARVIAATNYSPEQLLTSGVMRKDLFFRLNVARIHLPPLREIKEDIPALVHFAITKMNNKLGTKIKGLSDSAMEAFYRYDWPGNVRELFYTIEAIFINSATNACEYIDLPDSQKDLMGRCKGRKMLERDRILEALNKTGWNKSSAARELNISRMTLYRKISRYRIMHQRRRNALNAEQSG